MIPSDVDLLSFCKQTDPFFAEYVKRSNPYTMPDNHFHPYYEVYYLLSGKRVYFVKDTSYPIEKGDLVFIGKHELHKTLDAGEASHERVILHFDDRFINEISMPQAAFLLSPFQQESHVLRLPGQEQSIIEQLMVRMLEEIHCKPTGYEIYPPHAVVELLLTAARFLQNNKPVSVRHGTPIHQKISEIVRYINVHYPEPMTLNTLSKQFFISPCYLSRMFKEITGFPFTDYLNLTRIKEAQRLLRETGMNITDIAASAGFDNFSHFGKMFKKIARISPRMYRKNHGSRNG